jgi:hypothetical protein
LEEYKTLKVLMKTKHCNDIKRKFILAFNDSMIISIKQDKPKIAVESWIYSSVTDCGTESIETLIDTMKIHYRYKVDQDIVGHSNMRVFEPNE